MGSDAGGLSKTHKSTRIHEHLRPDTRCGVYSDAGREALSVEGLARRACEGEVWSAPVSTSARFHLYARCHFLYRVHSDEEAVENLVEVPLLYRSCMWGRSNDRRRGRQLAMGLGPELAGAFTQTLGSWGRPCVQRCISINRLKGGGHPSQVRQYLVDENELGWR